MANENLFGNVVTPTDVISAGISAAFVEESVMLNITYVENLPVDTDTKEFRKSGSLAAQILGENAAYTEDANSELTDSSVSAVAEMSALSTEHSLKALRFGGAQAQVPRFVGEHGRAHGRLFDTRVKTLFSSVTNSVISTTTFTKDNLLDGIYNVESSVQGALSGRPLVAVLDRKAMLELRKEISDSGAAAYTQQVDLGILGAPRPNGFRGMFLDVEIYTTSGLPTTSDDDIGCIYDPGLAFATMIDGGIGAEFVIHPSHIRDHNGSAIVDSHMWFKTVLWNDTAASQLRSNT